MDKKISLVMLAVVAAFVIGAAFPLGTSPGVSDSVTYHSLICACKNSVDGSCNQNNAAGPCKHNTISTFGKNATRDYLNTDGARQAFDVLTLSNWTPDIANSRNFTVELTGGLARSAATVTNWGGLNGNWSLVKTWTSIGAQFLSVNTTGVFNDTTAGTGTLLCGGTFTSVNLESADTLTINYTLWIS